MLFDFMKAGGMLKLLETSCTAYSTRLFEVNIGTEERATLMDPVCTIYDQTLARLPVVLPTGMSVHLSARPHGPMGPMWPMGPMGP